MTPWLIAFAACRALDGDTLVCGHDRVRLRYTHAPELSEPGGREAKDRLAALVDGKRVVCRVYARDRFGRLVGECGTGAVPSLDAAVARGGHALRR